MWHGPPPLEQCLFHRRDDLDDDLVAVCVGEPNHGGWSTHRDVIAFGCPRQGAIHPARNLHGVSSPDFWAEGRDGVGVAPLQEREGLEVHCLFRICSVFLVLHFDQVVCLGKLALVRAVNPGGPFAAQLVNLCL